MHQIDTRVSALNDVLHHANELMNRNYDNPKCECIVIEFFNNALK